MRVGIATANPQPHLLQHLRPSHPRGLEPRRADPDSRYSLFRLARPHKPHGDRVHVGLSTPSYSRIFQAITPAFWGSAADCYGRRPIYIVTVLIWTLACLGTALCPTNAYWLLMVMRILQSSGGLRLSI